MKFAIIRTGVANLASVRAAFKRLSVETVIVDRPADVPQVEAVILPGVGAFDAGITVLRNNGWDQFLLHRYESRQPTLAICLGMQLLCTASEESSGLPGLGILPGAVKRFPATVTIPQFGWNQVSSNDNSLNSGYTYFANSFCLPFDQAIVQSGWDVLTCDYGIRFVAAARKANWLACQFHPELSGDFGAELLQQWITTFSDNLKPASQKS